MAGDAKSSSGGSAAAAAALRPLEQGLKCPRCNSPNTKFCYYNNYSLSQPRHFCKSCRRYWTKGGALRNVPMGGGSRKNRKQNKAASGSSSSSHLLPADQYPISGFPEPGRACGLSFLGGMPPSSPAGAVDFRIGMAAGASSRLLHGATASSGAGIFDAVGFHEFINLADGPHAPLAAGFGYPISAYGEAASGGGIVSSIESLSSINQDLHWRLQQQRMAELCGGGAEEHKENVEVCDHAKREKACGSGSSSAGWTASFLENSCSFTTSSSSITNSARRSGSISQSNWSGPIVSAAWNDYLPQFSAIP